MDIFRSKEIYRKIRKREEGQDKDPLVAIRGLYVVGDYMYPVYDNACIRISEIKTKHPRIVDYTSRTEDKEIDNSIVGTIGMSIGGDLTLQSYYHKPLLCQPEPMLMITAVNRTQCTITDGDVTY